MSRKSKKQSRKADGNEQIRYTAEEKKIILAIAEELRATEKAENRIGKLVDEMVAMHGGTQYGERTVEKIAAYPDINCSAQHLRHCWNLHRFTTAYGDKLTPERKQVCRSSMFQIARLLDLAPDMDEKEMLKIIDDCVQKTVSRGLPVDDVREMVSRRLDEFGRSRKSSRKRPKAAVAEARLVATDEFDLVDIADSISWMSDPDKFGLIRIVAPETRMGLTRLISELVSISRRLPEGGSNQDLGAVLIKRGQELEEIGRLLLESDESPEEVGNA